jgi:hypothetical protein
MHVGFLAFLCLLSLKINDLTFVTCASFHVHSNLMNGRRKRKTRKEEEFFKGLQMTHFLRNLFLKNFMSVNWIFFVEDLGNLCERICLKFAFGTKKFLDGFWWFFKWNFQLLQFLIRLKKLSFKSTKCNDIICCRLFLSNSCPFNSLTNLFFK